jgi:hypothetical protein
MKSMDEIFKKPNIMRAQYLPFIGQGAYLYRCGKLWATVVMTPGGVTDHVSVQPAKQCYKFTLEEREYLKNLFFEKDELDGYGDLSSMGTVHFWLHHMPHEEDDT